MEYIDLPHHKGQRIRLVNYLRERGINNEKILNSFMAVPRHLFVPPGLENKAYADIALPIYTFTKGNEKMEITISQPFTVAFQTYLLDPRENDKVLEIGTGSGYQAAILAMMNLQVFSIERIFNVYLQATKTLHNILKLKSIRLFFGDGSNGLPEFAPYDGIIITASVPTLPLHLISQIKNGGKIVVPVGTPDNSIMYRIIKKSESNVIEEKHGYFRFVPLLPGTE